MARPGRNRQAEIEKPEIRESDETIDIRIDDDPVLDLSEVGPGKPGACPLCAETGYLDRIDPKIYIQFEHCRECGCRWVRNLDDLAEIQITDAPTG